MFFFHSVFSTYNYMILKMCSHNLLSSYLPNFFSHFRLKLRVNDFFFRIKTFLIKRIPWNNIRRTKPVRVSINIAFKLIIFIMLYRCLVCVYSFMPPPISRLKIFRRFFFFFYSLILLIIYQSIVERTNYFKKKTNVYTNWIEFFFFFYAYFINFDFSSLLITLQYVTFNTIFVDFYIIQQRSTKQLFVRQLRSVLGTQYRYGIHFYSVLD